MNPALSVVFLTTLIGVGQGLFLGLYVASAIYIALFMVILGKYSWIKGIAAALVVNVLFFLMFEVWFKVPLHKGLEASNRFSGRRVILREL